MATTSAELIPPSRLLGDPRWTVPGWLRALAPSPDGARLWALTDRGLAAWEVPSGDLALEVPGAFRAVTAQQNALLVTRDLAIERWSYAGERLDAWQSWPEQPDAPLHVAARAEVLVTVRRRALTRTTAAGSRTIALPFAPRIVCVSPRGDRVLLVATDRYRVLVLRYDAQGAATTRSWSAETKLTDAALLDDGTCLLAGAGRRLARVHLDDSRALWVRNDAGRGLLAVAIDGTHALLYTQVYVSVIRVADGATRALFHSEHGLTAWSAVSPGAKRAHEDRAQPTTRVAIAPDASWVALWETSASVQLFDPDGRELGAPRGGRARATCLAWAPDGRAVFTGAIGKPEVTEWSLATGEPVAALEHPRTSTASVDPSPDGRFLAVACHASPDYSEGGGVVVLERASGLVLATPRDANGRGLWGDVRWLPDASGLVVLADFTAMLWVVPADTWRPRLRWTSKVPRALLLDVDAEAARLWVLDAVCEVPLRGQETLVGPPLANAGLAWAWEQWPTLLVDGTLVGAPIGYPAQWAGVSNRLCRWEIARRTVLWAADEGDELRDDRGLAPSRRWLLTRGPDALRVRAMDDGRVLATLPAPGLAVAALSPRGDAVAWLSVNGLAYIVAIDAAALDDATEPPAG